jgi:hypothetical protein
VTIPTPRVIQQTKKWVSQVVIGLNLCPFAAQPFEDNRIEYIVSHNKETEQDLQELAVCFSVLENKVEVETILLIFPEPYKLFDDYLELLYLANLLLDDLGFSGVYQLASFHPEYHFEGSEIDDASNFTNRSPYPMLHILREKSIERAVKSYNHIETIPQNNVKNLQSIGFDVMQQTLKDIQEDIT